MAIVMKYHLLMSNLVYIAEVRPKFSALHFCYFLQRSLLEGNETTFLLSHTMARFYLYLRISRPFSFKFYLPFGFLVCFYDLILTNIIDLEYNLFFYKSLD